VASLHALQGGIILAEAFIMPQEYVEVREGGYYLIDSRVTLDSIVQGFLEGMSPEAIAEDFPTLSLEQVYGAITFYLAHRPEVDASLAATQRQWEDVRRNQSPHSDSLRERLARARTDLSAKRA